MLVINKNERKELIERGVRIGENGISHTVGGGRKKTYYLCASEKNMKLLNSIRNNVSSKK